MWLERARRLLPAGPDWPDYLDMAVAVAPDPLSADRDELLVEISKYRRPRPALESWRVQLATGQGSPLFRTYLDLTLACGPLLFDQRDTATAAALQMLGDVPLLQYRAGICGKPALLETLLQHSPDFADANLELGRFALQRERPDHDAALDRFRLASARFPTSALLTTSIANIHQEREEWTDALDAYQATLALVPSHRDALLGATISHSHLLRHNEAIASASRLIELDNWFIADAYYWRAWNEYQLDRTPAARADVDRAKALASTAATLVLSGIVAWREGRLEFAESELEAALNLDFGQCDAATYLGGVRAARRRWAEGLAAFQHAEQCLDLAIATRRKAIAVLVETGANAQTDARHIASHERAIIEAERRRGEVKKSADLVQRQIQATPR
jgi:tetratricopeptide (TPR) repeat protein